jgi:hypothetical protein
MVGYILGMPYSLEFAVSVWFSAMPLAGWDDYLLDNDIIASGRC